jgi:peroxiredoxin
MLFRDVSTTPDLPVRCSMLRPLRSAAAGIALLVLLGPALAASAQESRSKVPNFKVESLAGERVSLQDRLGKGPVLIDFWATWCKPCIKELPYVQRLHEEYEEHGLRVLAVTIDTPRSQSQVKKFVKTRQYTFEVLLDGSQDVFRKCQGKGTIPYVVILDSEGFIRYQHTGYRPGDEVELEKIVVELLEEQGVELPGAAGEPEPESEEAALPGAPSETTG